ncbi:ATP-binding cassette domain-containing protein [Candidatus Micrarchaeota archaeon]|nr:ATP-binding cassette domain-containing protein [Candidatus Micrarchaeota archaeon]
MKPVLSVRNISKSFCSHGQQVKALDRVGMQIRKGEVYGLLGPNGAGKTTLIAILCGFLVPDRGKASMFGMDCTSESERIQKKMNFVSGFSDVSEFFTAEELLHFYCMLYNLDNAKKRVEQALEATRLHNYRNRIAADFSSGLCRRFLISKALLNDPEVLLLDEPTVGLDVDSAARMRNMIKQLKSKGKTILLTTHNMKEAEELCDRVGLIKGGRIIAEGTFRELRKKFFPLEVLEINSSSPEKLRKAVSGSKAVVKTSTGRNSLKIYLKDRKGIDAVLGRIAESGVEIKGISTIEPELEDLYTKVMRNE